jgi:hypothetical protein
MENYLGFIETGFVVLVLLGIAVIEFVARRLDRKRKDAEAKSPRGDS